MCSRSGLTHSEAGRVSSAKASLDGGPGNPHYTACWQSIRVRMAQETQSCRMAHCVTGNSKAVILRTKSVI